MFACVYIPDFPVEAIVRVEPELREQAVAVVEGRPPLLKVLAVNERARQAGIEIGMTQVQAQGYATSLQLRKRAPLQEQAATAALMDCACAISPRVFCEAPDTVLLDITGLERLFGPPAKIARELARRVGELGMEANVGVAANVEAAIHAARGFSGTTVIPRGREAERLAALSVDILFDPRDERAPEMIETLERWGVRTFRALALLPEIALSQRLGKAGVHLRKLARGEGSRPLVPGEPPLEFEEAVEMEDAIDLLDPLMFVLNRMLDQLCARLATRSLAAQELRLRMEMEQHSAISIQHSEKPKSEIGNQKSEIENAGEADDGEKVSVHTLKFPVPMLDVKVFLKLLQLELKARPPQAPVTKIWLRAEPAHPRTTQGGLFLAEAPEPERLEVTLARISGVVSHSASGIRHSEKQSAVSTQQPEKHSPSQRQEGMEEIGSAADRTIESSEVGRSDDVRVGVAEVLDTHRPDAFHMRRFVVQAQPSSGIRQWVKARRKSEEQGTVRRGLSRMNTDCKTEIKYHKSEIEGSTTPRSFPQDGSLALRRFRPPLAAEVRVENGVPVWLRVRDDTRTTDREEHAGEIVWASGPWRASGEWWSEQQWSRDVWDVKVQGETVTVYRIYSERGEWWIEGTYD